MRNLMLTAIIVQLTVLAGCASDSETTSEGTTTTATASASTAPADTSGSEAPAMPDPDDVRIEGDHLVVDGHINFAYDSDEILDDSSELLDHIALLLKNHADEISHLRIVGHTDIDGGHEHNQDLSERRAAAVAQALVDRGVSAELEHDGVGELEPLCEEDTDECHAMNRRVEFIIIPEA